MDTVLNIIMNPVKAFNQLKAEEKFPVMAFIILLILALINAILNVPINEKVSELTFANMPLPESQADMAIQMTHKLRYLTMIGGFIGYIIMLFVHSLILFVIALIFRTKLSYTQALRLIIYSFVALAIGSIVNTLLIYFKGIDNINNMYDIMLIGLNMLTSVENIGVGLYVFLASVTPFQIWFIILLIIGIKIFTDSAWAKSWIICLIYWLIITIFPAIITHFSQMTLANKGLM